MTGAPLENATEIVTDEPWEAMTETVTDAPLAGAVDVPLDAAAEVTGASLGAGGGTGVDEREGAGGGHPAVDAAVRAVINAVDLPVAEQLAAYEGAHQTLREVLASIED